MMAGGFNIVRHTPVLLLALFVVLKAACEFLIDLEGYAALVAVGILAVAIIEKLRLLCRVVLGRFLDDLVVAQGALHPVGLRL